MYSHAHTHAGTHARTETHMLQTHQEFSDKMGATRRAMSRIDMPGWLQSTIFDYYQVGRWPPC